MNKDLSKADFSYFSPITTRWHDNDVYGHVNNVVYYSFFDTAVNRYMIDKAGLDIHNGDTIAYVVNSSCNYFSAITYPDSIEVGVRVKKLGRSSVHYELGIFSADSESTIKAFGEFVHVFVERKSGKSTQIPDTFRHALLPLAK